MKVYEGSLFEGAAHFSCCQINTRVKLNNFVLYVMT